MVPLPLAAGPSTAMIIGIFSPWVGPALGF
jgi:hypothetical protein